MSAQPKDARLYVRLSSAQRARIDHAEHVLADRRLFQLDDAAWESFQELLDRPVQAKPRLAELLERQPPRD